MARKKEHPKKKAKEKNPNMTAIYIRVSTEEQAKKGISLDAQKERLTAFCTAKVLEMYKIYMDDGYSAGSTNRPALKELIEDANEGRFSNILVYKIDRFSRNLKDLIIMLDEFQKKKINFISATEPIDTTSAIGNAFMQIIGVFAELERGMVAERVKLAFEKKINSKEFLNRPPLGYKIEGKTLKIIEKDAAKVRDIFNMRIKGMNYKDICEKAKIPISSFYHIIKNPAYIGYISYNNLLVKGNFPAIITKDMFARAHRENKRFIYIDSQENKKLTDSKF